MKQPKPILTIKVKCKRCQGWQKLPSPLPSTTGFIVCPKCKGTGFQSKEIYKLEDFECKDKKCYLKEGHPNHFKIPFKDYEIKKVSDFLLMDTDITPIKKMMLKHNIKAYNKVVIK